MTTICADAGNDSVYGRGGNDVIRGGSGNDVLRGGEGNDRLLGRPGRDTLYGVGGADGLKAQDGRRSNDVANGGSGADSCTSDPGDVVSSCGVGAPHKHADAISTLALAGFTLAVNRTRSGRARGRSPRRCSWSVAARLNFGRVFYLPSAVAMTVAAARGEGERYVG